ncbi:hypothetical protein ABBQ38_006563 [Trebouxia sp. C0009 RCD-2024]
MWAFKYYIFPCVLAAILVAGCGVSAFLRHAHQLRLVAVASQPRLVPVVHKGCVRAMRAKYLVPGDVVVVQPGLAVCDMVLLQGHVLAEEARFRSGNSQVRKVPYEYGHDPEVQYHPDTCWPCTIFTGSVIQQALFKWTTAGNRIVAFVSGQVLAESQQDLANISLMSLKQHTCNMELLGFAVMSAPLRADSASG